MAKRVLVTGATGQLGAYLVRELVVEGGDVIAWGHSRSTTFSGVPARLVDLTDVADTARALAESRPDVVIHAAAEANVSECAKNPGRAQAINAGATATIAQLCDAAGARMIFVSTDLVFDGKRGRYVETDPVAPLSIYGRTKVTGELAVLPIDRNAVVRVSWMFGPSLIHRDNFFDQQLTAFREGAPVRLYDDEWRTPLSFAVAAQALIRIAVSEVSGLCHVGGPERMSRLEFGQRLAAFLGVDPTGIEVVSRKTAAGEARPQDVSLDSTHWRDSFPEEPWPTFEQALTDMAVGQAGT